MASGFFKRLRVSILYPFSGAFNLITAARNLLFDSGILEAQVPGVFTISVGNLSVGGTGKTPHVEYIIEVLLGQGFKVGFISRGYGRRTKGLVEISNASRTHEVGDEPLQIYKKFPDSLKACVAEDRLTGSRFLLKKYPDIDVLVLDDAYQHRKIGRNLNVLLTTYQNPFFHDHLMPSGTLREARANADRADLVIVTKCPVSLNENDKRVMVKAIRPYSAKPVYFSTFQEGSWYNLKGENDLPQAPAAVITAIANGRSFAATAAKSVQVSKSVQFPDHFKYTQKETEQLVQTLLESNKSIVTTEKDAVKLSELNLSRSGRIFVLPVKVQFLFNEGQGFNKMILDKLHG